ICGALGPYGMAVTSARFSRAASRTAEVGLPVDTEQRGPLDGHGAVVRLEVGGGLDRADAYGHGFRPSSERKFRQPPLVVMSWASATASPSQRIRGTPRPSSSSPRPRPSGAPIPASRPPTFDAGNRQSSTSTDAPSSRRTSPGTPVPSRNSR